jgi:hypothetical protein
MSDEKKEPNYPDYVIKTNPHGHYWMDIGSAWIMVSPPLMDKGIRLLFHALPTATANNKGEPITKAVLFPFERKPSE